MAFNGEVGVIPLSAKKNCTFFSLGYRVTNIICIFAEYKWQRDDYGHGRPRSTTIVTLAASVANR